MKKTYQTPATIVVKMKTYHLMSNSLMLSNQSADTSKGMLSRENDGFWEDDEE